MKNADKPINPSHIALTEEGKPFLISQEGANSGRYNIGNLGLTKREYFAGLAMQGLMSSFTENAENGFYGTKEVVSTAIEYADELLKQLEKE